jgi:fructokinase
MAGKLVAGIETGGTKILACIRDIGERRIIAADKWTTSSADKAASDLIGFLSEAKKDLAAVGMAAFGPLIVDPASADYGTMLATTKSGWTGSNLRARIEQEIGIPVAVDSDVNAAAIAEQSIGAGKGRASVAYVTVGTGIGAGLSIRGQTLKGELHPECGHLPILRRPQDDFPSVCGFHANCAEGLVSGPALRKRLGEGRDLSDDAELVELVADYLGQLAATLVLAWTPNGIVWGGGVISGTPIISLIEARMRRALNGYGVGEAANEQGFCVPAELENAGLEGALLMAEDLAKRQ